MIDGTMKRDGSIKMQSLINACTAEQSSALRLQLAEKLLDNVIRCH